MLLSRRRLRLTTVATALAILATFEVGLATAQAQARVTPTRSTSASSSSSSSVTPDGVPSSEVGSLLLNDSGSALAQWPNQLLGSNCSSPGKTSVVSGNLQLETSGVLNNCAEVVSPGTYSSGVFEARIDFAAGKNGEIADWPAFWLSGTPWPYDGEIDVAEGLDGWLCGTYHYNGDGTVPTANYSNYDPASVGPDCITKQTGWHTVDLAWSKGYIAVYYDGKYVTGFSSSVIVSAPENIIFDNTSGPYGNTPYIKSDLLVQYVRVWSFK